MRKQCTADPAQYDNDNPIHDPPTWEEPAPRPQARTQVRVTSYSGRKQLGSKVRLAGKVESRERHQPRAATRHQWSGGATGGARGAGGGGKEVQPGFLSPRKLVLLLVNKSNTPVDPQVSAQVPQGLISPRRSHTDGRRPLRARLLGCLGADSLSPFQSHDYAGFTFSIPHVLAFVSPGTHLSSNLVQNTNTS